MQRISHLLTALSVFAALAGLALAALASSCTGALPPSKAIAGWETMPDSTRSGSMGSKASYDAYDGAVEHMRDAQGIRFFAQRSYQHKASRGFVSMDVYQLISVASAQSMMRQSRNDYRSAQSLTDLKGVKDQAFVCSLNGMSMGFCQRGKYFCQVTLSQGATAQDRDIVKAFVTYASRRLGG